jgi:hypothetical protein
MKEITLKLKEGHGAGQSAVGWVPTAPEDEPLVVTCGADGVVLIRETLLLEHEARVKLEVSKPVVHA